MKISCILLATGRVPQLRESVAAFLAQDYPDCELLIMNGWCIRQTLVLDNQYIKIYNIKEPALPMKLKSYACQVAAGDVFIAWDEMSVALPGFLSSVAAAIEGREWCWFDKELCLDIEGVFSEVQASEYSFAFTKKAFQKFGPYPPGINGACDRNLIGKITAEFPGENTPVYKNSIKLIRMGTSLQRENVQAVITSGRIKLEPALLRDYQSMVDALNSGTRDSRVCVVMLGRYGDIINILPVLKLINDLHGEPPHLMVSAKFADLLDGVSYVKPFVTQLDNSKLGAALEIAKQSFKIVINCQIWGEGWTQVKRERSYNKESWRNAGMVHLFGDQGLKPVFDQRDLEREAALTAGARGYDGRPMILVNVSKAVSSPYPACAALLEDIVRVWGQDYNVVNLAEIQAHRLYDFLGLFEAAACLISVDTSWLHLSAATDLPVVALVNPKGEGWASTIVRGNAIRSISYDRVNENNRQELHESIACALSPIQKQVYQSKPVWCNHKAKAGRLIHLVDRIEIKDAATQSRIWKCQQGWDDMYATGELIPAHLWEQNYPRNAKDILGDNRRLPYLKDLLAQGLKQSKPEDILLFTNSDNFIHPELPAYLRFHAAVYQGPCSLFRTEIRNGQLPNPRISPEIIARSSHEKHVGRDAFAFPVWWLLEYFDEIPDYILGAKMWDVGMAIQIRLQCKVVTTNANIWDQILPAECPNGYTAHLAHQSAWLQESKANDHNGRLFLEFAAKYCPHLKVTPEGNLA